MMSHVLQTLSILEDHCFAILLLLLLLGGPAESSITVLYKSKPTAHGLHLHQSSVQLRNGPRNTEPPICFLGLKWFYPHQTSRSWSVSSGWLFHDSNSQYSPLWYRWQKNWNLMTLASTREFEVGDMNTRWGHEEGEGQDPSHRLPRPHPPWVWYRACMASLNALTVPPLVLFGC